MQSPSNPSKLIIYLIEDNPIDIFIVQQMLELSFPQGLLVPFSSPSQALEELNRMEAQDTTHAQVLLLDLDMPLLDGWEFLESYERSHFYKNRLAPVFIFTASINPKDVSRSKAYRSVAGFLSKPLQEQHIALFHRQISS